MSRILFFLFLFSACTAEKVGTSEDVVIFGLWVAGEKPSIQAVLPSSNNVAVAPNELFELLFPNGETAPFVFNGHEYALASERSPQPGEDLRLNWFRRDDTATVFVTIPPSLSNVTITSDTLQSVSQNESTIDWTAPDSQHEFAWKLTCIEPDPEPLPWFPGTFAQVNSGPQVATQLVLQPTSFGYYGTHELTISVLNEELRDAFFFDLSDIRGLLKQAPDNVSGGTGFVTGVSTKRILLEIE